MAWYPGAVRMELQPESNAQAAIRPTQFILHSVAGPWTARRIYEYWRDSTNLESHFGLGYAGDLAQYIGTQTRADANASANRRPDGTGAVSCETASNTAASDKWTDAQVDKLVALGVWLHKTHAIPLRICRTPGDPGFGYHRLFSSWNPNGHSCPGDARVKQFREVIFPRIKATAAGGPVPPPTTTPEDPMSGFTKEDIYDAVWSLDRMKPPAGAETDANPTWQPQSLLRDAAQRVRAVQAQQAVQSAAIAELVKTVAQLAASVGDLDPAAIVAELRAALESIDIRIDVPDSPAS